ncbi:Probable Co/Zn/Cd efflux system membrane fusion protein [Pseudoalteromonas luteoviolacea B = ATCC 29581]|nr:Probable Co/Zn/Cd efflux system membrane fusion protein [Pseudoalteromonas luteoviolacea B = ATCC 29581]
MAARLLALVPFIVFLSACQEAPPPSSSEALIRPVKLFTVNGQSNENIRHFPAEVVANQGSYLAFRVSGELMEFPALAGQHVNKGQLLAKLDPEDFQLQVEERQARYELALSQLARIEKLKLQGVASQAEFDQALANKEVAESALKIAKTNLENAELRAPFSGTVAKVFVKNFENIQAKQNILRLETRDLMDVVIQVPEKLVARVDKETNYQPTVMFDGFPNKSYELTIKEWDTQADPITLTYKVVFSLPVPTDFNLLAGMTGHVYIDLNKISSIDKNAHIVPVEAVFSNPDQTLKDNAFVWVYDVQTQTVSKKAVTVGKLHHNGIEVISGLEKDQIIVSAGVHHLKEGLKVRPWQKERGL